MINWTTDSTSIVHGTYRLQRKHVFRPTQIVLKDLLELSKSFMVTSITQRQMSCINERWLTSRFISNFKRTRPTWWRNTKLSTSNTCLKKSKKKRSNKLKTGRRKPPPEKRRLPRPLSILSNLKYFQIAQCIICYS